MSATHMDDMLSAYLDGELDGRRKAEVEAHLAGCPECAVLARGHEGRPGGPGVPAGARAFARPSPQALRRPGAKDEVPACPGLPAPARRSSRSSPGPRA